MLVGTQCRWTPGAFAVMRPGEIHLMDADGECDRPSTHRAMHPILNAWFMVCDECGLEMSRVRADVASLQWTAEKQSVAKAWQAEQATAAAEAEAAMKAAILDYWKEHPEDADGNAGIELTALVKHLGAKRSDVTRTMRGMGFECRQVGSTHVNRWSLPAYLSESEAD